MRSPTDSDWLICSRTLFTASSTSFAARCRWRCASASINSDLVIARVLLPVEENAHLPARVGRGCAGGLARASGVASTVELFLQQCAKLGRATAGVLVLLQRAGKLVLVLRADRELQRAALSIHADELGFDRVADL